MIKNYLCGKKIEHSYDIIIKFYDILKKDPYKIAIEYNNEQITFYDLEIQSNRLAQLIQKYKGDMIGVLIDRSPFVMVAILAIYKINAVYVPLLPTLPKERIRSMIEQTEMAVIISEEKYYEKVLNLTSLCKSVKFCFFRDLEQYLSEDNIDAIEPTICCKLQYENVSSTYKYQKAYGKDNAYVMFTSGTTGEPKGVLIHHRSVINLIESLFEICQFCQGDTIIGITQFCFDISMAELLIPLVKGVKLLLLDDITCKNPVKILSAICKSKATILHTTPSRFKQLMVVPSCYKLLDSIRLLLLGGEQLDISIVEYVKKNMCCKLYNVYGPTETTIWSTIKHIAHYISIGEPIYNTEVFIIDEKLQVMNEGCPGEICIGGTGVATYLNIKLNELKFIDNPLDGGKAYRTGDLGYISNNELYYIKRKDQQVKINGNRIELEEIRKHIINSNLTFNAAVAIDERTAETKRIIAYVVSKKDYDEKQLRKYLCAFMPDYMQPHQIICLNNIPLTNNGKIDYRALGEINLSTPSAAKENCSNLEMAITFIWESILNIKVGVDDNFFDIGGDSLKYYMMISQILESLDYDLFNVSMYEVATIKKLLEKIKEEGR